MCILCCQHDTATLVKIGYSRRWATIHWHWTHFRQLSGTNECEKVPGTDGSSHTPKGPRYEARKAESGDVILGEGQLESLGERCKLPHRGLGRIEPLEPQSKSNLVRFNVTIRHLLASLLELAYFHDNQVNRFSAVLAVNYRLTLSCLRIKSTLVN